MIKPSPQAILFDADSIIYTAGFASEQTIYEVGGVPLVDSAGDVTTLTRAKKFCTEYSIPFEAIDSQVYPEPLTHALQIMKTIYEGIENNLQGYGKVFTLLSDRVTFRHHLATIRPYKGTRESNKCYWHDALRQNLEEYRDGFMVEGLEADDLCGIFQREDTVVVGIDKDLLTIPGSHYHWKKHEFMQVSELEADRNFYTQILEGDKADNIAGLSHCAPETVVEYGLHHTANRSCGPAAAKLILESAETSEELYKRTREAYVLSEEHRMQAMGFKPDGRAEQGALMDLLENGRLLHMTREIDEQCLPTLWELPVEADREAVKGVV